jgi:sarcosine oxidase subunit beta
MSRPATFDVVIVGGGISGVMSAYHLARAGRSVLLIERGVIAGEASGRNGGHVHPSTYDPAQRALGLLALDLWPQLVEQIELPTEYRQQGSLSVAMPGDERVLARAAVDDPDEPVQVLSPAEAREIVPFLAPEISGAVFNPKPGNVNPILAAKAFAYAARQLGVEIWEGTTVTGVDLRRDAISGVHTSRGFVATEVLVNCAGAWASTIGDMVGLRIPVIPHRLQILLTEEIPAATGATIGGHNIYARQALSGQIHFGLLRGPAWDPPLDRFDRRVSPSTLVETARYMAELAPGLADVPVLRSWSGVNSITPDGAPIVDAPRQVRGLVIAAGFWYGVGIGVATGKVVSELIVDGRASVDISGLTLERFDRYPTEVNYPYDRWRAAGDGATESPAWPATGLRTSAVNGAP